MPKYRVETIEHRIYGVTYLIDAPDPETASRLVEYEGGGDWIDDDYQETTDTEVIEITEVKEKS